MSMFERGLSEAVPLPNRFTLSGIFRSGGRSTGTGFGVTTFAVSFSFRSGLGGLGGVLWSCLPFRRSTFSGFFLSTTFSTASTRGLASTFSGSAGFGNGFTCFTSGGGGAGSGSGSSVCCAHGGTIVMSIGMITSGLRKVMTPMAQKNRNSAACTAKAMPNVRHVSPLAGASVCSNPTIFRQSPSPRYFSTVTSAILRTWHL